MIAFDSIVWRIRRLPVESGFATSGLRKGACASIIRWVPSTSLIRGYIATPSSGGGFVAAVFGATSADGAECATSLALAVAPSVDGVALVGSEGAAFAGGADTTVLVLLDDAPSAGARDDSANGAGAGTATSGKCAAGAGEATIGATECEAERRQTTIAVMATATVMAAQRITKRLGMTSWRPN